ncbi:hypothetical protein DCAR_0416884 [Daucus carota subsp. sativus]|uniref:mannan endo-1,4-beta-mannosidase n=1 Tax=Daucus carota subsp. sativus TaxID=79200 RepID=A0AAF1AW24_DAUCS|nr:hypothetical protein DCAR_0416884 [Daucus carota subsp. sativus]
MACFGRIAFIFALVFFSLALVSNARHNPLHHSRHRQKFVSVKGSHFSLKRSPFLFNGFNSYWMMSVAADLNMRHQVTQVFRDASAAGMSVCRTWAFADGGSNALQLSPGNYDERVFQGLDFVISEAKRFNIYLILSFVNNYKDYGGRQQYVQWARNAGVQVKNDDDFYTHPVVKGYYRNHVQRVITRINTITKVAYKDDSTIMAWELMNEPRCDVDYSGRTVNGWVQEMASLVKSIDKKHLLTIGMEGFYGDTMPEKKQFNPGYQVGTDYISNHLIKEIDFATIHAYPDICHHTDAKTILKKPLVIAEFGKSSKDPGFSLGSRDVYMGAVYKYIYRSARHGGTLGGSLVWQVLAQGMQQYGDGYEIVLSENPTTDSVISRQSHAMNALSHLG